MGAGGGVAAVDRCPPVLHGLEPVAWLGVRGGGTSTGRGGYGRAPCLEKELFGVAGVVGQWPLLLSQNGGEGDWQHI